MTLLTKYQSNLSWNETIPVMPVYYSRQTGFQDLDLRNVLQREPELTLDVRMLPSWEDGVCPTGFGEVNVKPICEIWNPSKFHQPVEVSESLEGICDDIIELHKDYFRKTWDSRDYHLLLSSGGRDSRIVAWILKQLQDDEGMDLGEFKFLCQGLEAKCFLEGMREMNWSREKYEVWNFDNLLKPDYYDFWHLEDNVNGFVGPQLFPTRIPGLDDQKTVLVSSSFSSGFHNVPELSLFHFGSYYYNHSLCASVYRFKDVLINTMGYDYVQYHTHISPKYFQKTVGGDLVRDTMLKRLGNHASLYHAHSYNFDFLPLTYRRINNDFRKSKLYKTFSNVEEIFKTNICEKNVFDWKSRDLRIYGLATTFEGLNIANKTFHANPRQVTSFHNTYWESEIRHQEIDAETLDWYASINGLPAKWKDHRQKIPDTIKEYKKRFITL